MELLMRRLGVAMKGRHVAALVRVVDDQTSKHLDVLAEEAKETLHRAARVVGVNGGGVLLPLSPSEARELYEMLSKQSRNPRRLRIWQRLRKALAADTHVH